MLIVFCVWSLSSLLFVVFGICALSAKKPMPFWTHDWANDKEINISDVKAYNKAVALLYFIYAFTILILGVPMLFSRQNSAGFIYTCFRAAYSFYTDDCSVCNMYRGKVQEVG